MLVSKDGIEEYKESEEYSGKEYEKITRKMFVLENLIRQRLGYVPHRITDAFRQVFNCNGKR